MTLLENRADAPPAGTPYDRLTVVKAKNPGRWVATAVVAVLLAMVANSLITNPRWEWGVVWAYLGEVSIVEGVWMTIKLTLITAVLGFALGTVLALMRLSRSPLLRAVSWGYTWVFRSVPLILQLLLWYNLAYLYQSLDIGIPFGPSFASVETLSLIDKFGAAILGLGLHQAAYSAEIVRTIVPTAVNEIIGLFKGTSIVYVLALGELFYTVSVIYGRTQRVLPMLVVAAIWYVVLTTVVTVIQYYVERHYAKGAVRTLPPTPLQRLRGNLTAGLSRVRSTADRDPVTR
jgi:polar amino acid transport system permease protein